MKITVRYLAQIRPVADMATEEIEVAASCSVREFLTHLAERHGEPLRHRILDGDGNVQPTVLVFVGEEQVGPGERVELKDGDVVTLLSPIAGGVAQAHGTPETPGGCGAEAVRVAAWRGGFW